MTKKEHGIISSTEHFFLTAIPNLVKDAMNSAPICRYLKLHPHESEYDNVKTMDSPGFELGISDLTAMH